MKKTTFIKFAGALTLLAMLVSLAVIFAVGVTASDATPQAEWKESINSSTVKGSGTLQEALTAAASDSTITYIKLNSDVDLGSDHAEATGGAFTLDLNNHTVKSSSHTLYLENSVNITITDNSEDHGGTIETTGSNFSAITLMDTSAIKITLTNGTVKGKYAINLTYGGNPTSAELTVDGGKIVSENIAINAFGASVTVKNGEIEGQIYWKKGTLDLSECSNFDGFTIQNGTGEAQTLNLPEGYYFLDTSTNEQSSSLANGSTYAVRRYTSWGTAKDNLTAKGTLQEALNAAASDSTITYIMLNSDIDLGSDFLNVNGGEFTLDLNDKKLSTANNYVLRLSNSVKITIDDTSTDKNGSIETTEGNVSAIKIADDSAIEITVDNGTVKGNDYAIDMSYNGDKSEATLTVNGGKLIGDSSAIFAKGASVTVKSGKIIGEIYWVNGTLDLSAHTDPMGITIYNDMSEDQTLNINTNYSFHRIDDNSNAIVDTLTYRNTYRIKPNGYQADWGTGYEIENGLIYSGTLQAALDAAASDSTITYIKLNSDIDLGSDYVTASGGAFTLDLNGKKISVTNNNALVLLNSVNITIDDTSTDKNGSIEVTEGNNYSAIKIYDDTEIEITVNNGTFKGMYSAIDMSYNGDESSATLTVNGGKLIGNDHAIFAYGSSVNVKGGELDSSDADIYWVYGSLDLSAHTDPDGISICNKTDLGQWLTLQDNYTFYDEYENETLYLNYDYTYIVGLKTFHISYIDYYGDVSSWNIPSDAKVGERVGFSFVLDDHRVLTDIKIVNNETGIEFDYVYDEDTDTYYFTMPAGNICVYIYAKVNAFAWGTEPDQYTSVGDLSDLIDAINAGNAPYVKVLCYYNEKNTISNLTLTKSAVIDLNGNNVFANRNNVIVLGDGVTLTILYDQEPDAEDSYMFDGAFEIQKGSKLVIDGANFKGDVYYSGGKLDISKAHLAVCIELFNKTEAPVAVADFVTLRDRYKVIDYSIYDSEDFTGNTVPTIDTLPVWDGRSDSEHCIDAVFTVYFDTGEGVDKIDPLELPYDNYEQLPIDITHPEGRSFLGWSYEKDGKTYIFVDKSFYPEFFDVTVKAIWGDAPIYVGGVAMTDGDYLASNATKTSKTKPSVGGYAYYKDGVLTLNNYEYTGQGFSMETGYDEDNYYALIYSTEDLVIELVGRNSLNEYVREETAQGVFVNGDLTIRGDGELWLDIDSDGLEANDITVESGRITLSTNYGEPIEARNLTVLGGKLITVSYTDLDVTDTVLIDGGELHILEADPEYDYEYSGLDPTTLTVKSGLLYMDSEDGVTAKYVNISGGNVWIYADDDDAIYIEYGGELNISGGKIFLSSDDECGIDTSNKVTLNITGGEIVIESYYSNGIEVGADSTLNISGGEIYIYSEDGYDAIVAFDGATVNITDGYLYIESDSDGFYIESAELNISGGEIDVYADGDGIKANPADKENADGSKVKISGGNLKFYVYTDGFDIADSSLEISGGEIYVYGEVDTFADPASGDVNETVGIFGIRADIDISGGKLIMQVLTHGFSLYENSSLDVSGGYTSVYTSDDDDEKDYFVENAHGIYAVNTDIKISGGEFYVYTETNVENDPMPEYANGVHISDSKLEIVGGKVIFAGNDNGIYSTSNAVITFGGKNTHLIIAGNANICNENTVPTINGDEIKLIFSSEEGVVYFEGVDVKHTWNDTYSFDNTHHYHTCSDEDCFIKNNFKPVVYRFFEDAGYAEHTIPEGETACTVCGYGATPADTATPENAVLKVGDKSLANGEYLTSDGKIVTEKPEDNYLYVNSEITDGMFEGEIVLKNFSFDHDGSNLIQPLVSGNWTIKLEGDNVLNAPKGIGIKFSDNQYATFTGDGTLTINARGGIVTALNTSLTVEKGANITIDAKEMGINAKAASILFEDESVINITSDKYGIYIVDSELCLEGGLTITSENTGIYLMRSSIRVYDDLTITSGKDGIYLYNEDPDDEDSEGDGAIMESSNYGRIDIQDATVNITAEQDAIDVYYGEVEIITSTLTLKADNCGISLVQSYNDEFDAYDSVFNITAGNEGLSTFYTAYDIEFYSCTLDITAVYYGFYIYSHDYDEDADLYFDDCNVKISSVSNVLENADVKFEDSTVSICASRDGIYMKESSDNVYLSNTKLSIVAGRCGIYGDGNVYFEDDTNDISIRASKAVDIDYLEIYDNYYINAELDIDEYTFLNEYGYMANYLVIRPQNVELKEVSDAVAKLEELISEGGAIEEIVSEIENVNALLDTLTNVEGEGRIDLIEKANAAIEKALAELTKKLEDAQTELNTAITNGDTALDSKITALNKALDDAKAAYAAADKTLDEKIGSAQATLDAAIKALDKKLDDKIEETNKALDDTKSELTQQSNSIDEALRAEIAALRAEMEESDKKAATWQTVTMVIAILGVGCHAGIGATWFVLRRKKKLSVPKSNSETDN